MEQMTEAEAIQKLESELKKTRYTVLKLVSYLQVELGSKVALSLLNELNDEDEG